MIFFNWKGVNTGSGHIGYVLYVTDTTIFTVEGNTKDEVGIRSYALDDPCVIGFGTPDYEKHAGENAEATIDFSCRDGMPMGRYILTKDRVALSSAADKNDRLARLQLDRPLFCLAPTETRRTLWQTTSRGGFPVPRSSCWTRSTRSPSRQTGKRSGSPL